MAGGEGGAWAAAVEVGPAPMDQGSRFHRLPTPEHREDSHDVSGIPTWTPPKASESSGDGPAGSERTREGLGGVSGHIAPRDDGEAPQPPAGSPHPVQPTIKTMEEAMIFGGNTGAVPAPAPQDGNHAVEHIPWLWLVPRSPAHASGHSVVSGRDEQFPRSTRPIVWVPPKLNGKGERGAGKASGIRRGLPQRGAAGAAAVRAGHTRVGCRIPFGASLETMAAQYRGQAATEQVLALRVLRSRRRRWGFGAEVGHGLDVGVHAQAAAPPVEVEVPAHCSGPGPDGWHPLLLQMTWAELENFVEHAHLTPEQLGALKVLRLRVRLQPQRG
eukprot:m.439446 g.439446  ORF g.439446 m.439446 type:complete len:329 (-) comp18392_c0_seq1:148-1134(-)